jgi:hypothetical protein
MVTTVALRGSLYGISKMNRRASRDYDANGGQSRNWNCLTFCGDATSWWSGFRVERAFLDREMLPRDW